MYIIFGSVASGIFWYCFSTTLDRSVFYFSPKRNFYISFYSGSYSSLKTCRFYPVYGYLHHCYRQYHCWPRSVFLLCCRLVFGPLRCITTAILSQLYSTCSWTLQVGTIPWVRPHKDLDFQMTDNGVQNKSINSTSFCGTNKWGSKLTILINAEILEF